MNTAIVPETNLESLRQRVREPRGRLVEMSHAAETPHLGGALAPFGLSLLPFHDSFYSAGVQTFKFKKVAHESF